MLSCNYIQDLGQKVDINLSSAHNKWDAMGLRLNLETYFQWRPTINTDTRWRNRHIGLENFPVSEQRDKELAEKFSLKPASFYNYLNQSGCNTLEGVDDADKFDALRLAFEVVQIPPDLIEGILSVLVAILWLGKYKYR